MFTKRGNYGFPKGKREKGESELQNAIRETEEETGLKVSDYRILNTLNCDLIELSRRGNPSVKYFIGEVPIKKHVACYDLDEDLITEWNEVGLAMKKLEKRKNRKELLEKALSFYLSK